MFIMLVKYYYYNSNNSSSCVFDWNSASGHKEAISRRWELMALANVNTEQLFYMMQSFSGFGQQVVQDLILERKEAYEVSHFCLSFQPRCGFPTLTQGEKVELCE